MALAATMNVLPLLAREFATASRRPLTHRLRLGFAAGSMIIAFWTLLLSVGAAGALTFTLLVLSAALLAIFVGIFVASDSISRERREGTLSLLLLTDLRPGEVVIGKFAAAGLVPFYTLLSLVPALSLCQLVGGMPAGNFWRAIAALLLTLVFSLSATLYVSSLCEDHRKACLGATLLLLIANPLWLCGAALAAHSTHFIIATLLFSALSLLFLRAAATRVARSSGYTGIYKSRNKDGEGRTFHFRDSFGDSPVAWMMLRRRDLSRVWKWIAGGSFIFLFAMLAPTVGTVLGAQRCLWLLFTFHLGYQLILLTRTAYAFYADRQNGALELLLGSPLSNEEIFEGFNRYLLRRSAPMVALLSGVDLAYAALLWANGFAPFAALAVSMALTLWITLFGLGWLGIYRSLMMNHPSLAMLATYARLSLLPVLLSFIFMAAPRTDLTKVAAFYLVSAGFLAIFFSMDARAALQIHGRTLLLRPYSEKPPHIENEWSFIDWQETDEADQYSLVPKPEPG